MANSDIEFDLDERDQELIEALAGNSCDHDSDSCGDNQNYCGNQDDANCAIPEIDCVDDWDDDGDDISIMCSNESGNISQIVGNDDGKIESIKDEIDAAKARLSQLEAKLAKAESHRPLETQQQSNKEKSCGDPKRSQFCKVPIKDRRQSVQFHSLVQNQESSSKTVSKNTNLLKEQEIKKSDDNDKVLYIANKKISKQSSENGEVKDGNMVFGKKQSSNVADSEKPENGENLFKRKGRLAHVPKYVPQMDRSGIDNINIERKKINIDQTSKPKQRPKEDGRQWKTEAYSGIRIVNPCISSTQMDAKMEGRRFIKLNTISRYIVNDDISGDWVTMGVIVGKSPPKTAANGKTFSIWKLSDLVLGYENETTSFFLFGSVYKEHWKTCEGTVVALLNSSIMPHRDNDHAGYVAITIDNPKKLMIMGTSKDFGICKGITKKGNQCSFVVNKVHGDFCEYHVSREHKKVMAGRMELQSSSTGPDLNKGKRMQAVKKDISSGQVCYAGRTLTWNEKGDKKKKAERKKSILSTIVSSNGSSSGKGNEINGMPKGKPTFDDSISDLLSEDFKSRLKVPTLGSRNLLKVLKKDEENQNQKEVSVKVEAKSAKDLIREQKEEIKRSIKPINLDLPTTARTKLPTTATIRQPAQKFYSSLKPKIGGHLHDDDFIEFSDSNDVISDALNSKGSSVVPMPLKVKNSSVERPNSENQAKLKAINLVRSNKIKINKDTVTQNKSKKSPRIFEKIQERVINDLSNNENSQPPKKKRKGILGEIFGEIDLESEEGKKLVAMKSENNHLVQMAEAEREQAYFNVLEKKEMYEEKMSSIMELKVTAVCCKICKYMHEFQSDYCKDQRHGVVRVEAMKRFFICKNCKNRTTSLKKFPVQPCRNCGSNSFEKTSMLQEKKGPKIGGETLLVRGEEHSKFFNSLK